jgi:hypothetical protein
LIILSENDLEIGVYLLDLGLENIAFNEKTDQVVFIDAENVLIADKKQIKTGK